MQDQHKLIKGYRDLSQQEIDSMNRIKESGEAIRQLLEDVSAHDSPDARWVAIARTHFQEGLMALTRAIAKPESF